MLVAGRARGQDDRRDRRRLRGRVPRRRGARQHPAGARLPARHRAHPRDARPRRGARGRRPRLRVGRRQRLLRRASFPGYGQLSGNTLDDLRAGHRGEVEPDKRDPADFALWKAAGEGRAAQVADRRAGARASRAGTSSARRWPGATWATGSTCTPAASTTSSRTTRTRSPSRRRSSAGRRRAIWVHGEHLLMAGRKMAKSAGNFQRVTELAERGLDPLAFRYLALTSRYGRKLNYSDASLDAAAAGLASLRARLAALGPPPADGPWAAPAGPRRRARPATGPRAPRRRGRLRRRRSGTRSAIGPTIRPLPCPPPGATCTTDSSPRSTTTSTCPAALAVRPRDAPSRPRRRRATLARARRRRGPRPGPASSLGRAGRRRRPPTRTCRPRSRRSSTARDAARAARDYARADELRRELGEQGWDVIDGPEGSTPHRR